MPAISTKVNLPRRVVEKKRIGGNLLLQLGEHGGIKEVSVYQHDTKILRLDDPTGQSIYLYPPRCSSSQPDVPFKLRAVSGFEDTTLNEATELKWLRHPAVASDPSTVVSSWRGSFRFCLEDVASGRKGLREPQLGALHATASHWTLSRSPATIVMPTGTGKTETMLSVMIYCLCEHVLVVVPSDVLREQIFWKFCELGCLYEIGALSYTALYPRVVLMRKGLHDPQVAQEIAEEANVIVATASVLTASNDNARNALAEKCTHLFIDEAHHVAALTWKRIRESFSDKPILQFTATPFRRDGKRIDGDIIYNYPLGHAQKSGYFRPITLVPVEELVDQAADVSIAQQAIRCLKNDLECGFDHLILARADSIPRAEKVLQIYEEEAPDLSPILLHSRLSRSEQNAALSKLQNRISRILVCIDMFGEGFDLPNLKIAALHDIHKSLAVTLQFIGRFTRTAHNVGDATVIVNVFDPQVSNELQNLYAQDADWNELLRRQSEGAISRELSLQELIASFSGELPTQVPLWNLRPGYSTIMYRTTCEDWTPLNFAKALPSADHVWSGISYKEHMVAAVVAHSEEVRWGRYRDIKNLTWHLLIAHWNAEQSLLYLYASDYRSFNCTEIAKAITGGTASLVSGPRVFRIFSGVERPMVRNLGASKAGTIRYTMYFGPDVAVGLSQVEKAESELNNLFGWGFEAGEKITLGCSSRRGKIWSASGGRISEWKDWCLAIGRKLTDDQLDDAAIVQGFLRPEEIGNHPGRIPLCVEWGEGITKDVEERISVYFGNTEKKLYDVDIRIASHNSTGPLSISISCEEAESVYELEFYTDEQGIHHYRYTLKSGHPISIQRGRGERQEFCAYMERDPVVVIYADGSFSYNNFFVAAPCKAPYRDNDLISWNWDGVNISVESEGPERRADSIQYKAIETIKEEFEIIFNDDDSGEVADIIAIRQDSPETILLRLVHCKYSSEPSPGARVNDLYQVCGQAQKSIRWKHAGMRSLVNHMKKRHAKWDENGYSRFIKGDLADLNRILKLARHSEIICEVMIVQPGLSKSKVSDSILQLLGSTELYLKKTGDAKLLVVCSP